MKCWTQPRFAISWLVGIMVGILLWMLPPMPQSTFTLVGLPIEDERPFTLEKMTSDGRYLIINTRVQEVWDREHSLQKPWITAIGADFDDWLLSPDEKTFLPAYWSNKDARLVIPVYDLA